MSISSLSSSEPNPAKSTHERGTKSASAPFALPPPRPPRPPLPPRPRPPLPPSSLPSLASSVLTPLAAGGLWADLSRLALRSLASERAAQFSRSLKVMGFALGSLSSVAWELSRKFIMLSWCSLVIVSMIDINVSTDVGTPIQ
eukprot:jgi/Botrbrau1/17846/Bobra.0127s0086.1